MSIGCMRCNKEGCNGLVVYEDEETGDIEELDSACITEWERKHY